MRENRRTQTGTCSPFPLRAPLAGLLRLGFLRLLPSFIIVVASSIFVFLLSKVIVLLVAAKVICSRDTEGVQASSSARASEPAVTKSASPAESFLDLDSLSSDSSLQWDEDETGAGV